MSPARRAQQTGRTTGTVRHVIDAAQRMRQPGPDKADPPGAADDSRRFTHLRRSRPRRRAFQMKRDNGMRSGRQDCHSAGKESIHCFR